MISTILAELLPWVLAAAGALAVFVGHGVRERRKGRKEGRDATYIETLRESAKRQEAGREAVSDLRGAGRDELLDQLRRNEGDWRE